MQVAATGARSRTRRTDGAKYEHSYEPVPARARTGRSALSVRVTGARRQPAAASAQELHGRASDVSCMRQLDRTAKKATIVEATRGPPRQPSRAAATEA